MNEKEGWNVFNKIKIDVINVLKVFYSINAKLVNHGAIDDNPQDEGNVQRKHFKEAIDETLAGKEVTVKESRSVGCTIKTLLK